MTHLRIGDVKHRVGDVRPQSRASAFDNLLTGCRHPSESLAQSSKAFRSDRLGHDAGTSRLREKAHAKTAEISKTGPPETAFEPPAFSLPDIGDLARGPLQCGIEGIASAGVSVEAAIDNGGINGGAPKQTSLCAAPARTPGSERSSMRVEPEGPPFVRAEPAHASHARGVSVIANGRSLAAPTAQLRTWTDADTERGSQAFKSAAPGAVSQSSLKPMLSLLSHAPSSTTLQPNANLTFAESGCELSEIPAVRSCELIERTVRTAVAARSPAIDGMTLVVQGAVDGDIHVAIHLAAGRASVEIGATLETARSFDEGSATLRMKLGEAIGAPVEISIVTLAQTERPIQREHGFEGGADLFPGSSNQGSREREQKHEFSGNREGASKSGSQSGWSAANIGAHAGRDLVL